MTDQSPPTADLPAAPTEPGERYEATIHAADPALADADALAGVSELDRQGGGVGLHHRNP